MGRKVFISYKYGDEKVAKIKDSYFEEVNGVEQFITRDTRARDYVNILQDLIGKDNVNLGEKDGESLDDFSNEKIETELKKRIKQSSITIVLISKGMKTTDEEENEQWIPWEVSYSLRVVPTEGNSKQMNAVLGIILPDENNNYDWYYRSNPNCNSVTHFTNQLFWIIRVNMFNICEKQIRECNGTKIHISEEPSFIKTVKWSDFNTEFYNFYLDKAIDIRDDYKNNGSYDVKINLK